MTPILLCSKACATPILAMESIMEPFPLHNRILLMIIMKLTPLANGEKSWFTVISKCLHFDRLFFAGSV